MKLNSLDSSVIFSMSFIQKYNEHLNSNDSKYKHQNIEVKVIFLLYNSCENDLKTLNEQQNIREITCLNFSATLFQNHESCALKRLHEAYVKEVNGN